MSSVTPKFLAPPLIETVLGVEFEPLSSWDIPHYGLFWQSIRQEYQNCIAKPPLISQLELIEPQETKAQNIRVVAVR